MRGGLGKTLLLAFLLLAIVPLSTLAFVTYHQVQRDIQQRLLTSLETVAALQEAHLVDWVEANHRDLAPAAAALERWTPALAGQGAGQAPTADSTAMAAVQAELEAQLMALRPARWCSALALVDGASGRVLAATSPLTGTLDRFVGAGVAPGGRIDPQQGLLGPGLMVPSLTSAGDEPRPGSAAVGAAVRYAWDDKLLLGLLSREALREVVASPGPAVEGLRVTLVTREGLVLEATGPAEQVPARPGEASTGPGGAEGSTDAWGQGVQALLRRGSGAAAYRDLQGVPVFGAYRWVPGLEVGILAEQGQARFLSGGETLTALMVGATLAVALLTAAIAAVVTRRITRPIVQLTATASWMARGDLSHRVAVTRRDEIGVLAGAFNRMAAELQILYANLEARVAERTAQLADANEQARHHARQLAISAEVARVASSIRDLPALLGTVVELIGRSFELDQVSIYLLCQEVPSAVEPAPTGPGRVCSLVDARGQGVVQPLAVWQTHVTGHLAHHGAPAVSIPASVQAALAGAAPVPPALCAHLPWTQVPHLPWTQVPGGASVADGVRSGPGFTGGPGVVSRQAPGAAGPEEAPSRHCACCPSGTVQVWSGVGRTPAQDSASEAGRPEMAIPLQVCGRTLGALHVVPRGSSVPAFGESDGVIYRSLADQIAIAIENVSAYALEHETVRRLRELDRIQSRFLTNMSHALRTPLNSIIGFSRVMLKGLDGSLNELQLNDLATIHEGGRQLLGLIDDLLELSQWDIARDAPGEDAQALAPGESKDGALSVGQVAALSESEVRGFSEGEVDLAEIVEGVMATACALARDKPIQLGHELPGDLARITTDGRLVRRLLLALLANAVKLTGEGQIRLVVTTLQDSVCFSVGVTPGKEPALAGSGDTAPSRTVPTLRLLPFGHSAGVVRRREWSGVGRTLGCGQRPACQGPGEQGRQGSSWQAWMSQTQAAIAEGIVERLGGELLAGSSEPAGGQEEGTAFVFTLPMAGREAAGLSSSRTEEAQ